MGQCSVRYQVFPVPPTRVVIIYIIYIYIYTCIYPPTRFSYQDDVQYLRTARMPTIQKSEAIIFRGTNQLTPPKNQYYKLCAAGLSVSTRLKLKNTHNRPWRRDDVCFMFYYYIIQTQYKYEYAIIITSWQYYCTRI